jgi:DNA mismatch repair ATPase MutL
MAKMESLSGTSWSQYLTTAADVPLSSERESHPVGTTVKVAHFFEYIPVRKQTATKDSAKCLAKIRRLMQAYALARPAVRFRLHVLKAKNIKGDFMYAPKASSNIEDAAFKVTSKDCALQCDWTALESDGFEIQAFLPKPTANGPKIANQGGFISVDSRPVSNSRGTMKQIVATFKERLRKSNHSLATVKDPFFTMNIICPPNSYDPNIEPAKDDVMFDNGDVVLGAVDQLLRSYYPEAVIEAAPELEPELEPPTSAQQPCEHEEDETQASLRPSRLERVEFHREVDGKSTPEPPSDQPRWRASMYGIDEEDFGYLQENQPPITEEEEEGRRAAEVSNPWTIARMNATIKPKTATFNGQLLSPAKSHGDGQRSPSSPAMQKTPHKVPQTQPLTPQTTSRMNVSNLSLDRELGQDEYQHSHHSPEQEHTDLVRADSQNTTSDRVSVSLPLSGVDGSEQTLVHARPTRTLVFQHPSQAPSAPRPNRQKQRMLTNETLYGPQEGPDDTWFGQPMRGSQKSQSYRRLKRHTAHNTSLFPSDASARTPFPAADESIPGRNTDIRNFLTRTEADSAGGYVGVSKGPSFTPINRPSFTSINHPPQIGFRPGGMTGSRGCSSSQPLSSRIVSPEPVARLQDNRGVFQSRDNNQASRQSQDTVEHFTIYEDSFSPTSRPRPSSAGIQRPSLMPLSPNKPSQTSRDMAAYFKQYQDRDTASADRSSSPTRRLEPRIPPPHELTHKSRPQRRRTTDAAQRTKSSKLPLERVPHGYHIQDVILSVHVSIASMIQLSRKLDMRHNSLEWGYPADEEAYDAFAGPFSEKSIRGWVLQLDCMLHERYEELPGADVRSMIHEAIQRGLDARKGDEFMMSGALAVNDVPTGLEHGNKASPIKVEDDMSDFDMGKFEDLDMNTIQDDDDVDPSVFEKGEIKKADEEFGDDIDDDMLLDM